MNIGEKLTFNGLFDRVAFVEIPIIQRDYAQGRKDEYEVRNTFLDALYNALSTDRADSNQSLDLDFIYGNIDDDTFSVLDGQQRLTTLFLLHWFLAIKNKSSADFRERFTVDNNSRFTYKTRPSSIEFFDAMTTDIDFANTFDHSENLNKQTISELIIDSNWFYLSWKQDPTVQACLNMLDSIEQKFSAYNGNLYQRLIDTEIPYITFQFLRLDSFGLSDELYIKMNARGKPLTPFENFKATLEQKIKFYNDGWPEYRLDISGHNKQSVDGYKYFIHKIDTHWADLFWPYRNLFSQDNTYDDELMNFIRLIILYQYLLDHKESSKSVPKEHLGVIMGTGSKLLPTTISEYEALNCLNQNFIIRLIKTFDLIYRNGLKDNKIEPYLLSQKHYSEEKTFGKVLLNDTSYADKLRFFAFYAYLSKHELSLDQTELMQWTRVIYNLTENTIIDGSDDFYRALDSIETLSNLNEPILDILKNNTNITGFLGDQILEERIKAQLLLKSEDWQSVIYESENHSFFKGQIGFLLNFSGVLAFYREHKNCDWGTSENNYYLDSFKNYAKSASSVFKLIEKSSGSIDYLWERAVLSKGPYFTERSYGRLNLLSTREKAQNIERDHSWRRLLRIGSKDRTMEDKQVYIKAVFDDPDFDKSNINTIKESLGIICAKAIENNNITYWEKSLIKYPSLFKYCNQGFIQKNGEEIILLGHSQRNHYHSELYTKILEIELGENTNLLSPFSKLGYQEVKSREQSAGLHIKNWHFEGQLLSIEITKEVNNFNIYFKNGTLNSYPEKIKSLLLESGFEHIEPDQELDTIANHDYFIDTKQTTVKDVITELESLCAKLRTINDE